MCAAPILLGFTISISTPALAKPGDPLPQGALQGIDWSIKSPAGLDRAFYFGGDNHSLAGATGELERYIDPSYCAAPDPVQANPRGGFSITVRTPTSAERSACHLTGHDQFISGLLTTRHTFSATYGYFEIYANLPASMRTWPAFWLLPTVATTDNQGAYPEIDVLEEYAGLSHGGTLLHPWTLDRTGRPISAIHLRDTKPLSCGMTVFVKPGTWHTYGVLWEPTRLTFYVDQKATCEEDIAITDPHYILINLGMDGRPFTPGPISPAKYPATMYVGWVLHRPLRP